MDADDVAHPERIQRQLETLESDQLDVIGCQVRIIDRNGRSVPSMRRYESWINEETLHHDAIMAHRFIELPIVNPTITARRKYFELKFEHNELPEDYDLMLRAANSGMRFGKVERVLMDWIDSDNRLTRNNNRYTREAFEECRRKHLIAGPLRHVDSVDLWGVGQTGKPWMRWLQHHSISIRWAFDINPRVIGQSVHGTRVLHPDDLPTRDRLSTGRCGRSGRGATADHRPLTSTRLHAGN